MWQEKTVLSSLTNSLCLRSESNNYLQVENRIILVLQPRLKEKKGARWLIRWQLFISTWMIRSPKLASIKLIRLIALLGPRKLLSTSRNKIEFIIFIDHFYRRIRKPLSQQQWDSLSHKRMDKKIDHSLPKDSNKTRWYSKRYLFSLSSKNWLNLSKTSKTRTIYSWMIEIELKRLQTNRRS